MLHQHIPALTNKPRTSKSYRNDYPTGAFVRLDITQLEGYFYVNFAFGIKGFGIELDPPGVVGLQNAIQLVHRFLAKYPQIPKEMRDDVNKFLKTL